jgi:hypothetical protein
MSSQDPVEAGALEDDEQDDSREDPVPTHDDPVESGALEDEDV